MRCCHGGGLYPNIDTQNVSLFYTAPMLVNLYRENFRKLKLKNKLGDPYCLLSNCNKYNKMQLFEKLKKICGVGSEPP